MPGPPPAPEGALRPSQRSGRDAFRVAPPLFLVAVSQGRILPLLGPAVVLYLVAEVVASSTELDGTAIAVCALAVISSTLPVWMLRRQDELSGARRVALVGVLASIVLTRWANAGVPSLYLELAAAIGVPLLSLFVLHLALDVPDRPAPIWRARRALWPILCVLAAGSSVAHALAVAPSFEIFGATVLVSPRWELLPAIFGTSMLALALAARVARKRLGSTPEALAAGLWAQLGLWAALATVLVAFILANGSHDRGSAAVRGLVAIGLAALTAGHVAMLGARRPTRAGRGARNVLAGALALSLVAYIASRLVGRIPSDPLTIAVSVSFALVAGALVHRACKALLHRALAPYGGRLLRAVDEALGGSLGATTLEELGEAILPALRRAAGTFEAEPILWTIDPPRQVRVDAAGVAHVEERDHSPAILSRLSARPGEIVVSAPLAGLVVRRPELRDLVDALERVDAFCVVPLSVAAELEGVLIVPRGKRRAALTLEEIDRLETLARQLSAQIALLSAHERARLRTRDAVVARESIEEELEGAREELTKLRHDARILKAGGAAERFTAPAIAYSPSMRALMRRVSELGPLDAPVLVIGEHGSALDQFGYHIHAAGGRRLGPLVVADCAAVRPERAEAAIFGESAEERPGWLRLAEGGTCVLLDAPALSLDAQSKLAEAIATRRAHPAEGAAAYPIDVRVIATSRVELESLARAGAFDVELYRRLEPLVLQVPPLRERSEDLPSLVLLALDRSCRTAGRGVMGIEPDALEVLVSHSWPGNQEELSSVIDRAVACASGPNVRVADLPPLALADVVADPWSGTYAELEARILEHAMERAGGNKSEAARMLGLKRTTFLDKLKRHDMLSDTKKQGTAA